MIELLEWIDNHFLSYISIVAVLFWAIYLLIEKWKE
jgi:hypothetical protein